MPLIGGFIAPNASLNEFRLTLTTALAVTTANVTGATTIYATPYIGDRIALYDGTATWQVYNSVEFSLALGTLTSGLPYDVFCFASANVPTLELLAWTNGTTRATALVLQNGVWSKTGALTRRYMGTFYTTSTTATEDSTSNRYLFNASNRVPRTLTCTDTTTSWPYTTATWRSSNASTAAGVGRFNLLQGLPGAAEPLRVTASAYISNASTVWTGSGVGIDATNANSATTQGGLEGAALTQGTALIGEYTGFLTAGQHFIQHLEISDAVGTTTWYGNQGFGAQPNGMVGMAWA